MLQSKKRPRQLRPHRFGCQQSRPVRYLRSRPGRSSCRKMSVDDSTFSDSYHDVNPLTAFGDWAADISTDELVASLHRTEEMLEQVCEETHSCLSGLPAMRAAIGSCTETLHIAECQLGDVEDQVMCREAFVEHVECRAHQLSILASQAQRSEDEVAAVQMVSKANEWLRNRADLMEQRHLNVVRHLHVVCSSSGRRIEELRLARRRALHAEEQRLANCARTAENNAELHSKLRSTHWQRLDNYQRDLDSLREVGHQRAYELSLCRARVRESEMQWRSEKTAILRDCARLESHIAEVERDIGQLEMLEEQLLAAALNAGRRTDGRPHVMPQMSESVKESLLGAQCGRNGLLEVPAKHAGDSQRGSESLRTQAAAADKQLVLHDWEHQQDSLRYHLKLMLGT